ncbi:hypothetical protein PG990_013377 [Apiospora arundinis]
MIFRRKDESSEGGIDCESLFPTSHKIEPDPDIAGIGIIISFLTTAWLVVGLLIVYYVIYYDPHVQPNHSLGGRAHGQFRTNPFDVNLYRAKKAVILMARSRLAKCADAIGHREALNKFSEDYRPGPAAEAALIHTISALSDLQLFTGLSLLICGFSIASDGMLGYHWNMITRLAWFSTIAHLAAMSTWSRHPRRNTVKHVYLPATLLFGSSSYTT